MIANLLATVALSASTLFPQPVGPPPQAVGELTVAKIIAYVDAVRTSQILDYVHAVDMGHVADYVNAVAAAEAPVYSPSPVTVTTPSSGGGSSTGDCYSDSPVPDYIINRESGGDPSAVNPSSGAYGCYQELPSHFNAGGACAGLDMHSVADQKQCAHNLINGSGGSLAPWALTR